MDSNSDTNSANYETVKDHYMYVHSQPMQDYYVTPQAVNEETVKQDKKSDRYLHAIWQKGGAHVIQWIVLIIVLLVSFCALGLSTGAYLDGIKRGKELKKMNTQFMRTAADVQLLLNNASLGGECVRRSDYDIYRTSTSHALSSLQTWLNRTVHEIDARYQILNYTQQKLTSGSAELDLTAGCTTDVVSMCVINHNNVGTPPTSLTCETPEQPLEETGFRNVNVFCSIDNTAGETNPVTSTMNIFGGEVSCLCSLVALTDPVASPECRLTIQRCPDTIRLDITDRRSPLT